MCDWTKASDTVTSHSNGFPCDQGTSVAPSGRLPSVLDRPTDSLHAGTCSFLTALQKMSLIKESVTCRGPFFLNERPRRPLASTWESHTNWWGWQMEVQNRYPTATLISSSDSFRSLPDSHSPRRTHFPPHPSAHPCSRLLFSHRNYFLFVKVRVIDSNVIHLMLLKVASVLIDYTTETCNQRASLRDYLTNKCLTLSPTDVLSFVTIWRTSVWRYHLLTCSASWLSDEPVSDVITYWRAPLRDYLTNKCLTL